LSPIPGFRSWLEERVAIQQKATAEHHDKFAHFDTDLMKLCERLTCDVPCDNPAQVLSIILERLHHKDAENLSQCLQLLAAHYIVREKHRGMPLDPVARFHLGNGASVYRVNVDADTSGRGWQKSFGVMVNYHYDMNAVSERQEMYYKGIVHVDDDNLAKLLF